MKVEQVTAIYKIEENGDLTYQSFLPGWNARPLGSPNRKFINELKIDDEVYSIGEVHQLIYDKLADIHTLLAKSDIDKELYNAMSDHLTSLKMAIMYKIGETQN